MIRLLPRWPPDVVSAFDAHLLPLLWRERLPRGGHACNSLFLCLRLSFTSRRRGQRLGGRGDRAQCCWLRVPPCAQTLGSYWAAAPHPLSFLLSAAVRAAVCFS